MIYRDLKAISKLYSIFNAEEYSASSHWKEIHSTFKIKNDDLKLHGMRGFGRFPNRNNFLLRVGHFFKS